jgi:hypothetical protein
MHYFVAVFINFVGDSTSGVSSSSTSGNPVMQFSFFTKGNRKCVRSRASCTTGVFWYRHRYGRLLETCAEPVPALE